LVPPNVLGFVGLSDAPGGLVSVTEAVPVREAASVTVTEYVPAEIELRFCVVAPLLHAYVNGLVPPETVRLMAALVPPYVLALVCAYVNRMGCVTWTVCDAEYVPLVTVTV
jgi:hypothetical protein